MTTTTTASRRASAGGRARTQAVPTPRTESEALASVEGAEPVGLPTPRGVLQGLLATFARPGPLVREAGHLAGDSVRILRGTDLIAPSPKDKRFADPAWAQHPGYRRLAQFYLAGVDALTRLVDDYEADGRDWREVEQARFVLNAYPSALAPTNTLLGNPAALKRAFDTGGRRLLRRLGHMLHDIPDNRGVPPPGDPPALTLGEELGGTPGEVVPPGEVIEGIQ